MTEATGFLYPFLDAGQDDAAPLLAELAQSAAAKWQESQDLRATSLNVLSGAIELAAAAVASAITSGGRLYAFGNGGSACDADAFAAACRQSHAVFPARSLAAEPAVLSALANDIGSESVFARQLAAHARAGDVAVAFSTSGGSANVISAVARARDLGVLTVGIVGYGGGALRDRVDHCLAVASESVHRVQEAQTALAAALLGATIAQLDRHTR